MKNQKIWSISIIAFLLVLFIFLPGFQGVKVERISLSGSVDKVDHAQKAVTVNGERMVLSPGTSIVDEHGNRLSLSDIKPRAQVAVEVIRELGTGKIQVNRITVKRNSPAK